MKKAVLIVIIIAVIAFGSCVSAQDKSSGGGNAPCPSECKMFKGVDIRAADWGNAWQMAKQACSNANSLSIQMIDRPGSSFHAMKVFECVDLKSSGELLVITVKKVDKQEESVMIIRATDILRIEVTKRAFAPD